MLSGTDEADFIQALGARSVLDAGCGTGRVAVELARRGIEVVGVDVSPDMIEKARAAAPHLHWRLGDLADIDLGRQFDAVVMAGNVMIFLQEGTEGAVLRNMARHLAPGGHMVTGFYLSMGYLDFDDYDRFAEEAGLVLLARYSGWHKERWHGLSTYAVSVHGLSPNARTHQPAPNPR
jgi:SAM-dependent methyltransferase